MDIKFTKSPQFATELSNFKEKKTDIYTAIKIIRKNFEQYMGKEMER